MKSVCFARLAQETSAETLSLRSEKFSAKADWARESGLETTKPSVAALGLSRNRRSKMRTILISSWEIMPQFDLLWTGDINIDASFFLIAVIVFMIRMRR